MIITKEQLAKQIEQQYREIQLAELKKMGVSNEKLAQYNYDDLTFAIDFANNLEKFKKDKDKDAKKELLKIIKNPREIYDILTLFCNIEDKYLFSSETRIWFKYQHLHNYIWSPINDAEFKKEFNDTIETFFPKEISKQLSKQTFDALLDLLKTKLLINLSSVSDPNICVFVDKVYHTKTFEQITDVEKNGPKKYITVYSPIKWEPIRNQTNEILNKEWANNPINHWLMKKIPNPEQLKVFRAICNVIFHSNRRYNLEFFLEIYGPGQTGKSTCVRLMEALIDRSLITSSNLKDMEQNMYEKAKIANKHLILLNEQKYFVGDSPFLKAATGGDLLNINQKYKDPYDIRNYGVIVITTNNSLIFDSSASAIMRRRISFNFDQTHSSDEANPNLITFDEKQHVSPNCEFYPHLPGFLDWVLGLSEQETITTIRNYLAKSKINPDNYNFVWWLTNHLCPFKDGELLVHSNDLGPGLYLQYKSYCEKEGLKPISVQNFISNITKDFKSTFNYTLIPFKHNKSTGFKGLTYQIQLADHFENWRNAWKKEYGDKFFGENTTFNYTDKTLFFYDAENIKNSITVLEQNIHNLIKNAPKGMYSLIGNPTKNANQFDVEYNQKYIPGKGKLPITEDDLLLTLTKKEHKSIFIEFLNNFDYNEEASITTEELYTLYCNFLKDKKYKPFFTKNQIKNQTYTIWNNHFHKKIKKANNIGPQSLKGLKGLQQKSRS